MPTKLRAWFDSLDKIDNIDREDTTLQRAFAVVIYHVIRADGQETEKEKHRFATFFKQDFDLDDAHVEQLHSEASAFDGEFHTYLEVLKEKIGAYPGVELKLMRYLNQLIAADKIDDHEYEVFDEIRKALFD